MCSSLVYHQRIEGDNGVSIEIAGRGGLCYREGTHAMLVDSEFLVQGSRFDMVLYTGSVRRWKPPYAHEIISDEKRGQIIVAICELLQSSGIKLELD